MVAVLLDRVSLESESSALTFLLRDSRTAQAAELSALDTQGLKLERAEAPRTDPVRSSARVGLVLRALATSSAAFGRRQPDKIV